ncbi:phosphorylase [Methylobacterium brachiatum]|uniref:Phosphorylase n=1 Tax=Methylobacterium brachiatum TaxID=269660 RepID=A0AAJ1TTB1_9HYPH|nr:phosphorylase [Methylobacterium brachiatum]MCB4801812.1 phosphorylase [Methylobacterium brachiatum]MDQ0542148.1 hopanoid-associated phosphorylase [Methylobacterium brachiatum]
MATSDDDPAAPAPRRSRLLAELAGLVHQRAMIDPAAPVLAVTGLARERRLAAGEGVEAVGAGGNPHRLRQLLDARPQPGCRAVISFGIAGGLDPSLKPGDVVVGTGIVGEEGRRAADLDLSATLLNALAGIGPRVIPADLAGVDTAILGIDGKAELRAQTGAAAVDMESHVAAAFAGRHGLPFAALRVICDPANQALPAFAAQALTPDGEPDIAAVFFAFARGRARLGDLMRLARDSNAAFASLGKCRTRLGKGLGIPTPSQPVSG